MVEHSKGYRTRGRKLLRKRPRERGMRGLSRLMYQYQPWQLVHIDIDPTYIETAPHRRYQGKTGVIIGRQGKAYVVLVFLGRKPKKIVTTAEHLKPAPGKADPEKLIKRLRMYGPNLKIKIPNPEEVEKQFQQ